MSKIGCGVFTAKHDRFFSWFFLSAFGYFLVRILSGNSKKTTNFTGKVRRSGVSFGRYVALVIVRKVHDFT